MGRRKDDQAVTGSLTDLDHQIRLRAFEWLREQVEVQGDVLPRTMLQGGFNFEGERVPLLSPQGIHKPRFLDIPLSITTTPGGPYDDSFNEEGLLLYRYRGTNANHRDNVGLREACLQRKPLVYFHGILPGRYLAVWPVYITDDDPLALTFTVAADDIATVKLAPVQSSTAEAAEGRRAYITAVVRQRLHQRSFRETVLHAYRERCALCRLRHHELLDAAHIVPDTEPQGLPVIQNGISLCKLHHAAFDSCLLGITPDYKIEIRSDILMEQDGPVLQHGIKALHKSGIILPGNKDSWPDRDLLDWRYQKFRATS